MTEWDNFAYADFACSHCGRNEMSRDFITDLQKLRTLAGIPFIVTSGYRCPDHPIERRKKHPGPHQTGLAVDLALVGNKALGVIGLAIVENGNYEEPLWTGFGVDQKGNFDTRFIHLDQCEETPYRHRPWLWSY